VDFKKSHTALGENIGAYRVQSDNPAKNSSMVAYLGSKQFQAEYGLPAKDFAKVMEDFRSKSVPGREPEHKAAFVELNLEVAALSLTPAYPGRSLAQSSKAQDLLKGFSHEASVYHDVVVSNQSIEGVSKEPFSKRAASTPLPLLAALNIPVEAFKPPPQARRRRPKKPTGAESEAAEISKRRKQPPPDWTGENGDYFVGAGELTKKGEPKKKMGRKPYSTVVNGKVVAPPAGIECGARPTPMKHKTAAMVTPSGINGEDLSLSIAELKAENVELNEHSASQLGQIIQLQKRLREKEKEMDDQTMAFKIKESELQNALKSQKVISSTFYSMAKTVCPSLEYEKPKDISPMKLQKKQCADDPDA
jgi:ribosomal protein S8E